MAAVDQVWVVEDLFDCEPEQEEESIATETISETPKPKAIDDGERLSKTQID